MTVTAVSPAEVQALVAEYVAVLNAKEVARRAQENEVRAAQGGFAATFGHSPEQYAHYSVTVGKRYYKVVQSTGPRSGSVHAFVEKATGDVYKAAGWAQPAKGVRYSLADQASKEACFERADFAGGYLYL